jgi:hypothetical protein
MSASANSKRVANRVENTPTQLLAGALALAIHQGSMSLYGSFSN